MRRYFVDKEEIFPGRSFEANGLAHPANWQDAYSADDMARYGITTTEVADPPPTPAPRRLVTKAAIVDRLIAAGKLIAARAVLDAAPIELREKWNARTAIFADDADALKMLQAIGADPAIIMAPE